VVFARPRSQVRPARRRAVWRPVLPACLPRVAYPIGAPRRDRKRRATGRSVGKRLCRRPPHRGGGHSVRRRLRHRQAPSPPARQTPACASRNPIRFRARFYRSGPKEAPSGRVSETYARRAHQSLQGGHSLASIRRLQHPLSDRARRIPHARCRPVEARIGIHGLGLGLIHPLVRQDQRPTLRPWSSRPSWQAEMQHMRAEAADGAFLDRDEHLVLARELAHQIGVERLGEARIGDRR
jgi:hypothetical protein